MATFDEAAGGGSTGDAGTRPYVKLSSFRDMAPFVFREFAGSVFRQAIQQHLSANRPCRSLDRLHLAAMAELGQRRLMTHDLKLADAAQALGHEVLSPGASAWPAQSRRTGG